MVSGVEDAVTRTGAPSSKWPETTRAARGRGARAAKSPSARPHGSSSTAIIGEPCETKRAGERPIGGIYALRPSAVSESGPQHRGVRMLHGRRVREAHPWRKRK